MMDVVKFEGFVSAKGSEVITDSRRVARHFGKRHADVLRAYDKLDCSPQFNERNFASVEYVDAKGELRRSVDMTKDGFMFLVMGFTGAKAAAIKEAFIDAFNRMAEYVAGKEHGAWHRLYEVEALDASSFERAQHGSRLLHERKAVKPKYEAEIKSLKQELQLSLPF
jgi:Rha family phage regulatory protein